MREKAPAIATAIKNDCQPLASAVCDESATEKNHAVMTTPFFVHCSTRIALSQSLIRWEIIFPSSI